MTMVTNSPTAIRIDLTLHVYPNLYLPSIRPQVEKAMTTNVPALSTSAKSISVPSMYHQANFDTYGRASQRSQILKQHLHTGDTQLIWPYNIGVPAIYPLSTWDEREFRPQFYSETNEKIMIAINSVCMCALTVLLALITRKRSSAIIKAASPLFCALTIFGCALMLASNYFNTLVVNDAHYAASVWLLSTGFTITFSALFVKTFRLWLIFFGKKLQVLKIRDAELLAWVSAFVLVDVIINAAWFGNTGMHTKLVVTDPIRSGHSYLTCNYAQATGPIYLYTCGHQGKYVSPL